MRTSVCHEPNKKAISFMVNVHRAQIDYVRVGQRHFSLVKRRQGQGPTNALAEQHRRSALIFVRRGRTIDHLEEVVRRATAHLQKDFTMQGNSVRGFIHGPCLALTSLLVSFSQGLAWGPGQPDLVMILAGDLGWSDLVLFETTEFSQAPNMESLARHGVTFWPAYAALPICSTTRASKLIRQQPTRDGAAARSRSRDQTGGPSTAHTSSENEPTKKQSPDERYRRLAVGVWEDDYRGKRTMTLNEDGTGKMVVELSGMSARLFAARLVFDMVWSIQDGRMRKRTVGGEPRRRVDMILKAMGDRVDERILQLDAERLLLLDQDGTTRYDWRRVR
jgi:hypothetical protein